MARARRRTEIPSADLPMTPMIDVVFQLLIYFIVTIRPIDVFAHLHVNRPRDEEQQERLEVPPNLLRINIYAEGYTINDRPVRIEDMDRMLGRLAEFDRQQTILILVSSYSPHEMLIRILDLCERNGLTNLSVLSTN